MDWLKNKTVLVTDGDSWTAGDWIDPKLVKQGVTYINDPRNDYYRLTKVWPHKLGEILDLDVENIAVAGSSNDGILRRTLNRVPKLLQTYSRNDILYIIGFSSPERKDFYHSGGWDTLYPVEIKEWSSAETDEEKFASLYAKYYWTPQEYITRYLTTVISLDSFLTGLGIEHIFFNAFYENEFGIHNKKTLKNFIDNFVASRTEFRLEYLELDNLIEQYREIYSRSFIKKTFLGFLKEKYKDKLFTEALDYHHPTEHSHFMWSTYLSKELTKSNL